MHWYRRNKRELPWRATRDPYAIWVSEIMLQQTQVATVIDYYHRFLNRFPTVESLAMAEESQVLALWSGLGYYRRARQLHAAAKVVVETHGGTFPRTLQAALALPGIGRYTAGAIVSFAYGVRAPVLEANTIRLFSRLLGLRESVETASSKTRLWQAADEILPPRGPTIGTLNQATMELGSQVCVPKVPNCHRCPVTAHCQAFGLGLQLEIPLAVPSKTFTHLRHALVIIVHRQHYLLRKNQPGQWWEGLWDFPRVDVTEEWQRLNARDRAQAFVSVVESSLSRQLGLVCQVAEPCHTLKHGVTRYRISVECFMAQVVKPNLRLSSPDWRWMSIDRLSELPLTSTAEKLRSWIVTNQYPQG